MRPCVFTKKNKYNKTFDIDELLCIPSHLSSSSVDSFEEITFGVTRNTFVGFKHPYIAPIPFINAKSGVNGIANIILYSGSDLLYLYTPIVVVNRRANSSKYTSTINTVLSSTGLEIRYINPVLSSTNGDRAQLIILLNE